MRNRQQKNNSRIRTSNKSSLKDQPELKTWSKLISDKIISEYAIPLTKNAEAQLHKLNEKLEAARQEMPIK